ncbi:DUF7305 domain-containing protein [Lyngbya confervoides]|uniref:DUF7305 domain-containing protein n=1 Tax=Lyngbya confervoides BDU141951 TaxID=1574623 RepID=A0ABD4T466_9CYAN|nr:hypothetical protein [Lyngbya confervoides]MCM1983284.1 hypothetical protein [Lyngbya confervoides BDU141951]
MLQCFKRDRFSKHALSLPSTLDQGFALPIAIGVGVVMMIIAMTMIIRSNQGKVASISQRSTSDSLAAAETGIAKFQSFLNEYREFASVPSTCNSNDCLLDWSQLATRINARPSCSSYLNANLFPLSSSITSPNYTAWNDITRSAAGGAQSLEGRFRLMSYQFDPDRQEGILQIQGTDNRPLNASSQPTGGVTELTVRLPVIPADTPNNVGVGSAAPCDYVIPPLPQQPNDIVLTSAIQESITLPRNQDEESGRDQYTYQLRLSSDQNNSSHCPPSSGTFPPPPSIDLDANEQLTIKSGNTITIVTTEGIDINGGKINIQIGAQLILVSCGNVSVVTSAVATHPVVNNNDQEDLSSLQFYLLGNDAQLTLGASQSPSIPFIAYVPDGRVELQGSGFSPQFFGRVWAQRFYINNPDSTSDDVNGSGEPYFLQRSLFLTTDYPSPWPNMNISTLGNRLQPITAWERQQR